MKWLSTSLELMDALRNLVEEVRGVAQEITMQTKTGKQFGATVPELMELVRGHGFTFNS